MSEINKIQLNHQELRKKKYLNEKNTKKIIKNLKSCRSKKSFRSLIISLNEEWRRIFAFYLRECFIFDLFNNFIKYQVEFLKAREDLYSFILDPQQNYTLRDMNSNMIYYLSRKLAAILNQRGDVIREKMLLAKEKEEKGV